ncbi:MAG: DUF4230 domain-containing protein [Oscillospiraceae bacterium]|jgi:hypothetical protein
MNEQNGGKKGKLDFLRKWFTRKILMGIVIVLALSAGAIGLGKFISSESKTIKIGFEDIGEFATQSAYCTEVNVTEASRELFGVTIPFTQSKYIYSYDILIKAGFDFGEIEWTVDDADATIRVKLPEAKILSSEIDMDSFKLYLEDESIFRQITLTENNEALATLIQTAEKNAVANGLLENARSNAETILTGFFANVYDLKEYEIEFKDK